jgi:hypothetical protein
VLVNPPGEIYCVTCIEITSSTVQDVYKMSLRQFDYTRPLERELLRASSE